MVNLWTAEELVFAAFEMRHSLDSRDKVVVCFSASDLHEQVMRTTARLA